MNPRQTFRILIINPNSSEAITAAIVASIDRMQLGHVRNRLETHVKGTDKLTTTIVHGAQCLYNATAISVKHN
jgi:Asp/Glu/hydantoin racemase